MKPSTPTSHAPAPPLRHPSPWLAAAGAALGLIVWTLPRTDRALDAWEEARALQAHAAPSFEAAALSRDLARELAARLAAPQPAAIGAMLEGLVEEERVQIAPPGGQPRRIEAGLVAEEHRLTLQGLAAETLIRILHRIDAAAPAWKVVQLRTFAPARGEGIDAEMVVQHLSVP